jgi:peptidyl-prolyl cis-trans isomerase C
VTRIVSFFVILLLAGCAPSGPEATVDQDAGSVTPGGDTTLNEATEGETPGGGPAVPGMAEAARPVPAQLPAVVAYVNGEPIRGGDLEMAVAEFEGRAGQPLPADQRDRVIRGVLDELIGYRLLLQESLLRKVSVPEAEVDARMTELRGQFPSEEGFAEALALRQMTLATLRAEARRGRQVDAMLEDELAADVAVTSAQVTEFYENNPLEFQQGERVRASHILIGLAEDADAEVKEQSRLRALGVLVEVRAGRDFAELAKQYSDDPASGANGGDLGYFERGQMVAPFEEAAFSLAPTQTSDIVESPFGYHIIMVIDRQESRTVPLDEVRPRVQEHLESQNRELQMQTFVEALKAKSKVDIYI